MSINFDVMAHYENSEAQHTAAIPPGSLHVVIPVPISVSVTRPIAVARQLGHPPQQPIYRSASTAVDATTAAAGGTLKAVHSAG